MSRPKPAYVANFDSATAMLQSLAFQKLHGEKRLAFMAAGHGSTDDSGTR